MKKNFSAIKDVLSQYPKGALLKDIELGLHSEVSYRTLQRWVKEMKNNGLLRIEGKARETRYKLEERNPMSEDASQIALSSQALDVLKAIKRPLQYREIVGYNTDFLKSYLPNITQYLTDSERAYLAEIGKTTRLDRPAGTYAKEILSRLLIDLSWNSCRLEGNTYSLLDTQRLISFGQAAQDKTPTESQMILNHKDSIEFLVQSQDDIGFNRYTVMNLHSLLANNLLPDPNAAGRLRTFGIGIYQSTYEPLNLPQLIEEMFDLILEKLCQIQNPFEQAFFIMVHLPYLQPFDDVNKRVSRLCANIPFILNNFSPLSFVDVPDDIYSQGMLSVYELNRVELLKDVFLWAYARSGSRYAALQQSLGAPDPFRLKYRTAILEVIYAVISEAMLAQDTKAAILAAAFNLPQEDRQRFIEAVETEILSLHEGNFARYRIRPSQFKAWQMRCNSSSLKSIT